MGGNRRHRAATAERPLPLLLAAVALFLPVMLPAQAVPRTDTPPAGKLRFTFEPVITTWEREFTGSGREQPIGASLPAKVFVHEERRGTPFGFEFWVNHHNAGRGFIPPLPGENPAT